MHAFQCHHQVVLSGELPITGVANVELHPVGHSRRFSVSPRQFNGRRVEIEPVHSNVGISLGNTDTRPAGAAPDVRNPGW